MGAITGTWPLWLSLVALVPAALAIGLLGTRLTHVVDRLADRTGLGEAVAGAVLLGAATSLAGLTVSLVAAYDGQPSLAVGNSLGGIAVQTSFIAWIDLVRREVNVEHAAASLTNVFTAFLLATLLALVLIGAGLPDWTIFSIHPVSALILAGYVYGVTLSQHVTNEPMWRPVTTPSTRQDEREDGPPGESLPRLLLVFAGLGIGVAAAGFVVSRAGISVIAETALTGTVVGTLMTSVTTSIPELVTAYAAVRRGALTLAVGGIIGGNAFDVLFIAASDAAYRTGSIYQALTEADLFTLGWAIVLTGILGAGLVSREERGIGFEGVAIIAIYLAGVVAVWSIG